METYDLAVEAEAIEREMTRLEDIVIPSLERQATHIQQIEEELDTLFVTAYEDPALARVRFDQDAILRGPKEATRQLRETPARYGNLNGGLLRIRQNQQVRQALAALEHRGAAYHQALTAAAPTPSERERGSREVGASNPSQVTRTEAAISGPPARDRFGRTLERLYDDPAGVRKNFEAIEQRLGTDRAASGLAHSPEGLGTLRPDVSRSAAIRSEYARAASLAAGNPRRFGGRREAQVPQHDRALRTTRERIRALRGQVADLHRRIRERTETSARMHGRSRSQMKSSLEGRLARLNERDRSRVLEAFTARLASRGRTAARRGTEGGGTPRHTRQKAPKTMRGRPAGVGGAARRLSTGSAAASLALYVAERSVRRGVEEVTGRETFSR